MLDLFSFRHIFRLQITDFLSKPSIIRKRRRRVFFFNFYSARLFQNKLCRWFQKIKQNDFVIVSKYLIFSFDGKRRKKEKFALRNTKKQILFVERDKRKIERFLLPPFFLHHVVQYLSLVSQISLSSIANKYCINFYDRYLHIFLSFGIFLWIFYIWRNRFDKMSLKRFLDNISISCQMTNKAIIKHLKTFHNEQSFQLLLDFYE